MAIKVLVVDDSRFVIEWFRINLRPRGMEVKGHTSPFGIPEQLDAFKPDILLLDVNMPAMQGDAVCTLLKKHHVGRHVPIILHSTISGQRLSEMAKQCGADGYLEKTDNVDIISNQLESYAN